MGALPENIKIYLSAPHECPYLAEETASSLIIDPNLTIDQDALSFFTVNGFRRSGDVIYRPHCTQCSACVSVRIPVNEYRPNRSQQRTARQNQDLHIKATPARFEDAHFELYLRYQRSRHPDSEMCDPDPKQYRRFLVNDRHESWFYEMYDRNELAAVAVCDRLNDGLSAIYTFFAPEQAYRGPGTFAVMHQIKQAKALGLSFVYLGYWISECHKMAYKTRFKPIQGLIKGTWQRID
ncbi:MAG: Aspartate/glutamate leucyltransferase [Gammaproteobacteria bacterium]|nr:Aspartate/glutamate leucyltransferase [Gammaproteobacteria bacterium]